MNALLLLETVTTFEKLPLITAPPESSTWKLETVCVNAVPGVGLGHVPMLNDAGGVPLGAAVGWGVGVGDTNGVGVAVPLVVAVGRTVGEVDGDGIGLADDDELGIGVGVEAGEEVEPLPLLEVGVGPVDAVDVGWPPGELLGAGDGTTPPVYRRR